MSEENIKFFFTENEINTCVQIIKSGANKGNICGCKVYQDNKCKRHVNKVINNNENNTNK